MARTFARALVLFAAVVAAGGCDDAIISIGKDDRPPPCESSADCLDGAPCVSGACAPTMGGTGGGPAVSVGAGGGPAVSVGAGGGS